MIITKNLVIDNKTFFPEHHSINRRNILKGVTNQHRSSIAGNAQATSLRVTIHFLVDNSSNLPLLQNDRDEFQLQTDDILREGFK